MNIAEVKDKYVYQLMRCPNVVGVGIGERNGRQVIKVLVTHKVPKSLLSPQDCIPTTLDGYETDVEAIGPPTIQ